MCLRALERKYVDEDRPGVNVCYPSTWESEAGASLSSRPVLVQKHQPKKQALRWL
jgi:hypothetical protein